MATKKDNSNSLLNYFLKAYKARYSETPANFNRYAKKWGFADMLEDLGFERGVQIIDYFFELSVSHDVDTLFKHYGTYNESYEAAEVDRQKRAQLAIETQKRVEEYRARRQS